MSETLGINQSAYGKLERGVTQITIERLEQIARIFKISITDILNHHIRNTEESEGNYKVRFSELSEQVKILSKTVDNL
jgi:transcriptional regulator with XRE-family HTH domain